MSIRPWFKVETNFPSHPKTLALDFDGLSAYLMVCCIGYASQHLTDGFVPKAAMSRIIDLTKLNDRLREYQPDGQDLFSVDALVDDLVRVGYLHPNPRKNGYDIHDFLHYQSSRDFVDGKAEAGRKGGQTTQATKPSVRENLRQNRSKPEASPKQEPPKQTEAGPSEAEPKQDLPKRPEAEVEVEVEIPKKKKNVPEKPSSGLTTRPGAVKNANDQRFELFWTLHWPKTRRVGKKEAKAAWDDLAVDDALFDAMVKAVTVQAASLQWQKESGAFIPHLVRWLRKRRWEDDPAGYPTADQVDATTHVAPSRTDKAKTANQKLIDEALAELGDKDRKMLDDGKTLDADFWPVDDEGGDDD